MTFSLVKKWLGHVTLLESAVHVSATTSCVTWDKLLQLSEPIALPKKWGWYFYHRIVVWIKAGCSSPGVQCAEASGLLCWIGQIALISRRWCLYWAIVEQRGRVVTVTTCAFSMNFPFFASDDAREAQRRGCM